MEINNYQPEMSKIPIKMYALVNQKEPISQRAFDRYVSCHKQNPDIEEAVNNIENFDIEKMPMSERSIFIQRQLFSEDIKVLKKAVFMIQFAPESEQKELIDKALNNNNPEIQKRAASIIWLIPEDERLDLENKVTEIINRNFNSGNVELQKLAVSMFWLLPESEISSYIKKVLNIENLQVRKEAIFMIKFAPRLEQTDLLEKFFDSKDIKVLKIAASVINQIPESDQDYFKEKVKKIVEKNIDDDDPKIKKAAISMIRYVPESDKKYFFDYAVSNGLSKMFIESPLYDDVNLDSDSFKRGYLDKTGSETTLLGGQLLEKSIVRHIEPAAFLAWQKIYDNYEIWQDTGFDYVPVEPIQAYRFRKDKGIVDVFSGVLDLNLDEWLERTSLFKKELEEQRDKIRAVVDGQKINHGHIHERNFVLSFFRKEDGSPDFSKVPRLYVIDFDEAVEVEDLKH